MKRRRCTLPLVIAGLLVAAAVAGVRWNVSPSVSPGFYRQLRRPAERGSLVAACLPEAVARWARHRGYVDRGGCAGEAAPVGKWIAGVEGDLVEVRAGGIAVAGRRLERSEQVSKDAQGRPVPRVAPGSYVLRPGEVWLHSGRRRRSLDSRVFGPLEMSRIRGVLEPLWVVDGQ